MRASARIGGIVLGMMVGGIGGTARADNGAEIAAKFGAREAVRAMSLAPDGSAVAFVAPRAGGGDVVMVADLVKGGAPAPVLSVSATGEHLAGCAWPLPTRLVCTVRVTVRRTEGVFTASRMFSLNRDGSDVKMVTNRESSRAMGVSFYGGRVLDWNTAGKPGEVLITRVFIPESELNTHLAQRGLGLGVERVNVTNLQRATVEQPNKDAVGYIADGRGTVRMMALRQSSELGYASATTNWLYRKAGSRDWQKFGQEVETGDGRSTGFEPVAVDPALDVVYGFDTTDGFRQLFRARLDGSGTREAVLEKTGYDIDDLLTIGRNQRVVGASFATDRREVVYFDPELNALRAALGKALPGQPQVAIGDATADEGALLLLGTGDTDPGKTYLYHKATRQLEELLPVRPELAGMPLAAMKPVQFPARDGTMIPGYLTVPAGSSGKNLPAIVMPHGGPGARDEWGFDWLVQFFAARGFAVLQPNFRGSTGYGEKWFQHNGFQSWRTAIGDVADAGHWLAAQGIAAPDRLAIFGWSYGGYAALQAGVAEPGLFKAIVAVAPVTDLELWRSEAKWTTGFNLTDAFIGHGPHVQQGSPAQNAAAITAPVLLFHGDLDANVDIEQSVLMEKRLSGAGRKVEFVRFPGLAHSLDDSTARTTLLAKSDAFLRAALGM